MRPARNVIGDGKCERVCGDYSPLWFLACEVGATVFCVLERGRVYF